MPLRACKTGRSVIDIEELTANGGRAGRLTHRLGSGARKVAILNKDSQPEKHGQYLPTAWLMNG
ncbi:hypothetical protein KL86PLE_100671 [uncultured Pleomorphomonas sp.]|uniref:Uncharacterized protein n=1 Tax=uncultured Pleomorphomonas sp. TaxID=442121 RepID=A0A212L573_9HYPH|nr:hypothetical protein KL86PLE_100671 [uncultured Pleomorphomonas sp.]